MRGLILALMLEYVLIGCNFDFLGGYMVVAAHNLVVTAYYLVFTSGYCLLLGIY